MKNFRVIRNRKAYRRKMAFRRFVTVSFILGVFVVLGLTMYRSRAVQLQEAQAQLDHYEANLSSVLLRQGYYLNEMVRLGDDDYVAMLARQHLLSLPDETVFIIEDSPRVSESTEEN